MEWVIVFILLMIFVYMGYSFCELDEYNVEGYDGKISNVTKTQCGTECTISENCRAFAFKPISSTCYISKSNILGEPETSIYKSEYSKLDARCNKINPINDVDFIDDRVLTQNSIYICSDGENNTSSEFQYANLGSSSLETTNTIGASAGRGVPTKVGDRPLSAQPLAVNYDVFKIDYPSKELVKELVDKGQTPKELEPNFYKLLKFDPLKTDDTKKPEPVKSVFIESDSEFLGQYMLNHQCVANVPLVDCLKFCDSKEKCVGTEWNKGLFVEDENNITNLYEGVCCPKLLIKKIVPRRNKVSGGKFYVKSNRSNIKTDETILLTRQNPDKTYDISDLKKTIDGDNRFDLQVTNRRTPDIYHHSEQDTSQVNPITTFILEGDLDRINR